MGGSCGHHHSAHDTADERRLLIAFVIILTFMVIEIAGGLISGSLALLADAGHMAADSVALLLALSAKWISRRETDKNKFPFGLERVQVLAGFINGLGLLLLVAWLVWEAGNRLFQPSEILTGYMFWVAIVGLVANIAAFLILHGGDSHDLNMRGAMLHVLSDIFGSVAAIVAAIVIWLTGFFMIDAILTLLVSVLIIRAAWPLLDEAARILMQSAPRSVSPQEITYALKSRVSGIEDIHAFHMWMLTARDIRLDMHIQVKSPDEAPAVLAAAKAILSDDYQISNSTIQIDYPNCPDRMTPAGADNSAGSGRGDDQSSSPSFGDSGMQNAPA